MSGAPTSNCVPRNLFSQKKTFNKDRPLGPLFKEKKVTRLILIIMIEKGGKNVEKVFIFRKSSVR